MAWADLWAVEMLLAAFAGGAFGAALGAVPALIFTGSVVVVLAAFTAHTTGSPFLAFGISAASLVFLNCGVERIPVPHLISLSASTAALALAPAEMAVSQVPSLNSRPRFRSGPPSQSEPSSASSVRSSPNSSSASSTRTPTPTSTRPPRPSCRDPLRRGAGRRRRPPSERLGADARPLSGRSPTRPVSFRNWERDASSR